MAYELTTWKPPRELPPFEGFETMWKEMDRSWDSFLKGNRVDWDEKKWLPALDLTETKKELVVKAEVPGMDAKDIHISLTDNLLTIQGEKNQNKEEHKKDYHLTERNYGCFSRSIALPHDVNGKKISASFRNGMLRIVLPKTKGAKKKEVKITVQ